MMIYVRVQVRFVLVGLVVIVMFQFHDHMTENNYDKEENFVIEDFT
jgi:hypothetical protein